MLQGLGYAGFGSDKLDDWRQFGTSLVGLQAVERGNSLLAFRMDDRKQRIVIDRAMPDGSRFFGWEVADRAALDALAAKLEAAHIEVKNEPQALADARRVRTLISFHDPAGNRLEAFYGAEIDETPFSPGRSISGFRTGPLGLGHAVLTVDNIDPMMAFYVDVLGFGLSDNRWNEELTLQRYELLFEAGLLHEANRRQAIADPLPGAPMNHDHRRILATGIARLRAKIKYRPVVFELMPASFTLLQLQRTVEALAGQRLHKQNFRRLIDQQGLVEETGEVSTETGGRPAKLVRFRREVLLERAVVGTKLPLSRSA